MVNKAAVLELRDFVAQGNFGFAMNCLAADITCTEASGARLGFRCGSAGCIGGHAAILWPDIAKPVQSDMNAVTWGRAELCEKLDIGYEMEADLTFPQISISYDQVTREMAVDVLTRFAETGRVEWDSVVAGAAKG